MRDIPRAGRHRLLGAVALVLAAAGLVTGCSAGPGPVGPGAAKTAPAPLAATRAPVPAVTGAGCAPGQIGPISASFVSAQTGFLLGVTLRDCAEDAASKMVLRKTTDGGLRWSALPAPGGAALGAAGGPPADGVSAVLFANARDGWAYGPGLWSTQDGGKTWRETATRGETVQSMATTGGYVLAAFLNCDPENCKGPGTFTVETSPVGEAAWRPVPGASGSGVPALTAQAGTATVIPAGRQADDQHVRLLTGPASGAARWVSRELPCYPGTIALSAPTASRRVLACATLGQHPATTHLYASGNAGRTWAPVTTIGLYDGASTVGQTRGGTLLVAGIYDGVELSRDDGKTWARPAAIDATDAVGGGDTINADLYTDSDGYVMVGWGLLWVTRDAGRTWARVTVR